MPHERFFTDSDLKEGQSVYLDSDEAHHLKVMRPWPGDTFEVINGRGFLAKAQLLELAKEKALLKIIDVSFEEEPKPYLKLFQAIPRMNRLDTILEKSTELGVTEIVLFPGDKSEKKEISAQQLTRVKHIAVAATKQSGRLYVPRIRIVDPIANWKKEEGLLFYGDIDKAAQPLWKVLPQVLPEVMGVCIGPEAGLTEKEEGLLKAGGFRGVALHQNILRTDTAPIAALALLSHAVLCANKN